MGVLSISRSREGWKRSANSFWKQPKFSTRVTSRSRSIVVTLFMRKPLLVIMRKPGEKILASLIYSQRTFFFCGGLEVGK